jgi:CheY-like chemotaxis protein
MEKAGLRLVVNAPPLAEPAYVDREMWEKIVLNLLSNAFKFTFEGTIEVSLRQENGHFQLAVTDTDTGTGIPADELPRLFERFHRVEGAKGRTHEGSGIGLALVQELTRLHGGSVTVESEYGKGSTFRVSIPSGTDHLPQQQIGGRRTQASTGLGAQPFVEEALRWLPGEVQNAIIDDTLPADQRAIPDAERPLILLADDNADMREYLARLLSAHYRIEAVADGEAALRAAARRMPSLVLSDVMMPRMDGIELLSRLRAEPRTAAVPVILLFGARRGGSQGRRTGGRRRRLSYKAFQRPRASSARGRAPEDRTRAGRSDGTLARQRRAIPRVYYCELRRCLPHERRLERNAPFAGQKLHF